MHPASTSVVRPRGDRSRFQRWESPRLSRTRRRGLRFVCFLRLRARQETPSVPGERQMARRIGVRVVMAVRMAGQGAVVAMAAAIGLNCSPSGSSQTAAGGGACGELAAVLATLDSGDTCTSCFEQHCCQQNLACQMNTDCVAYEDCAAKCSGTTCNQCAAQRTWPLARGWRRRPIRSVRSVRVQPVLCGVRE